MFELQHSLCMYQYVITFFLHIVCARSLSLFYEHAWRVLESFHSNASMFNDFAPTWREKARKKIRSKTHVLGGNNKALLDFGHRPPQRYRYVSKDAKETADVTVTKTLHAMQPHPH
ncbi:hypothetical protein V8C34DRAFT_142569 [Trichoderma compactum]